VNRLMGLKWLAGVFFPERWERPLEGQVVEFYRSWYQVAPEGEDLERLLDWTRGQAPE
jgi:iron complex transport system substrate-binding protein